MILVKVSIVMASLIWAGCSLVVLLSFPGRPSRLDRNEAMGRVVVLLALTSGWVVDLGGIQLLLYFRQLSLELWLAATLWGTVWFSVVSYFTIRLFIAEWRSTLLPSRAAG